PGVFFSFIPVPPHPLDISPYYTTDSDAFFFSILTSQKRGSLFFHRCSPGPNYGILIKVNTKEFTIEGGVYMKGIAKASFILSIVTVCVGAAAVVLSAIQLSHES
ncbi:MAG: hypothetical protein K0R19_3669, partial [Bacillota bacterium]|nr:hypothetical protein [Bacillota bacterium]